MSKLVFLLICLVALGAAIISSVFGVLGGALLFVALSWTINVKAAIPVHGLLQLIGNNLRIAVYFKYVQWWVVAWFSILLIPGILLGSWLYAAVNSEVLEITVALGIMASLLIPPQMATAVSPRYVFVSLGFFSGFLGMIMGVTGPLIASFFVMANLSREQLVATKSVCQGIVQAVKVVAFWQLLDFDYTQYTTLIILLTIMILLGTFMGKAILKKFTRRSYDRWSKVLLLLISLSMLIKPIMTLLQQ